MSQTVSDEVEASRLRRAARLGLVAFTIGLFLRYAYVFEWHPLMKFIYSDMEGYLNSINNALDPHRIPDISDTIFPPGTCYFFLWMKVLDPSMGLAMSMQFMQCVAVPILIALLAARIFSPRTGWYALAMTSLYFPLIDYYGYLMSEGPFTFFLLIAAWLFVSGVQSTGIRSAVRGLLLGITIGVAASMKSIALPVAAVAFVPLAYFIWKQQLKLKGFVAAGVVGLMLVLTPLSIRATRLNEGRFCLIANELSRSVLLGHFGDIRGVRFQDTRRNYWHEFGCPTAIQHGYTRTETLQCGVYENGPIFKAAFDWMRAHPILAVELSVEHILETFFTSEAWPSYNVIELQHWVVLFHGVFIFCVFLPAAFYLRSRWSELWRLKLSAAPEIFVCAPVIALIISVFIAAGEARYRIPFDGFLIILAARYFTRKGPPAPAFFGEERRVDVMPVAAPEPAVPVAAPV